MPLDVALWFLIGNSDMTPKKFLVAAKLVRLIDGYSYDQLSRLADLCESVSAKVAGNLINGMLASLEMS